MTSRPSAPMAPPLTPHVEWRIADGLVPYLDAVTFMEARAQAIADRTAPELIWLVEHPALYTSGTSSKASDLLAPDRFPVFATGRGGQYTYHGPGQRVVYVLLDVKARTNGDIRHFVELLETWIIATLAAFNVRGETRPGRVGVWVQRPTLAPRTYPPANANENDTDTDNENVREDKIAAIGIRIRRGVSYHGLSLNVDPDLSHFDGIVPCGLSAFGVTSLVDLGLPITMADADVALKQAFERTVGPILQKPQV